jgi:hypothetical protein
MKRLILIAVAAGAFVLLPAAAPAATHTELVYADGQTYEMVGATLITNASPGVLSAPPLYILGFPASGTTPITLPSGYQPQCNPCLQEPIAYHDHLITGAPGLGTAGTAHGAYRAPWRIVVMVYTHAYAYSTNFRPVTSDDQLAAAEAAGEFQVMNPGAPDPYQIWTNNVLICPVVMQHGA